MELAGGCGHKTRRRLDVPLDWLRNTTCPSQKIRMAVNIMLNQMNKFTVK